MFHTLQNDSEVYEIIGKEQTRLDQTLNLIAAENHAPRSIMQAMGSVFNTKTIEGYPGRRFHAGCIYADEMETLAVSRCKALFDAEYANVQPHSGTSANLAVYFSVLDVGDRILAMNLPQGGHLSHGHQASITSKCFKFKHYGLDLDTERIDYGEVRELAHQFKPRMIVAGASAYSRLIDYAAMARIAGEVGAYLLTDMAHIAGLVAAKVIPSPVTHSDFVTFTCYKTMMGGRGGVILSRQDLGRKIDRTIFPGCQGTSPVSSIAAKAIIFKLATTPEFVEIQQRILENADHLATELSRRDYRVVTGGTDNHQILLDLSTKKMAGSAAETALESVGIVTNKNVIPRDVLNPGKVSGLRLGSAAVTTRGMGMPEMARIADLIDTAILNPGIEVVLERVAAKVIDLCKKFPIPYQMHRGRNGR